MAVSKRLRYEILRRDSHQCRYCGAAAPDAKLTIDHVVPTALGGTDEPTNLVTACQDCNAGKSSVPADSSLVSDVIEDAQRWATAMRQAADEFAAAAAAHPDVYNAVDAEWSHGNRPSDWRDSIDQFINAGLPAEVIIKMAQVAQGKRGQMGYRWSYFCGCCWNRIRDMQERAQQLVGQPAAATQANVPHADYDSITQLFTFEEPAPSDEQPRFPKLQAIQACLLCDEHGYRGRIVCDHIDRSECGAEVRQLIRQGFFRAEADGTLEGVK